MIFLDRLELLVVGGNEGAIIMYNVQSRVHVAGVCTKSEVTCLCRDSTSDYLVHGEETGHITLWQLAQTDDEPLLLSLVSWQAHSLSVKSIAWVERPDLINSFIVTSSRDGLIKMFSAMGEEIGCFGQDKPWDLSLYNVNTIGDCAS